jgi:hypothetical protein
MEWNVALTLDVKDYLIGFEVLTTVGGYVEVLVSLWLFYFLFSYLQQNQKNFLLDGLKKLEQRRHKLRREYVELIHFVNPVARCFLYKTKDLSAPSYLSPRSSGSKSRPARSQQKQAAHLVICF